MSGAYHASVNVICFDLRFMGGGGFAKCIVRFLIG